MEELNVAPSIADQIHGFLVPPGTPFISGQPTGLQFWMHGDMPEGWEQKIAEAFPGVKDNTYYTPYREAAGPYKIVEVPTDEPEA